MEKDSKKIIASEEDVESFNTTLIEFTKGISEKLKEIKESDGVELAFLKDEKEGLSCEVHSKRLTADKLLDITAAGITFLKNQRLIKQDKVGGID